MFTYVYKYKDTEGHNSHTLDWSNTQFKTTWPEEMYEAKSIAWIWTYLQKLFAIGI